MQPRRGDAADAPATSVDLERFEPNTERAVRALLLVLRRPLRGHAIDDETAAGNQPTTVLEAGPRANRTAPDS